MLVQLAWFQRPPGRNNLDLRWTNPWNISIFPLLPSLFMKSWTLQHSVLWVWRKPERLLWSFEPHRHMSFQNPIFHGNLMEQSVNHIFTSGIWGHNSKGSILQVAPPLCVYLVYLMFLYQKIQINVVAFFIISWTTKHNNLYSIALY